MKQPEHAEFLAKRRWLQSLVAGYRPQCTADSAIQLASPHVMIYGSSIAGTAFEHGDVDFAVVFPTTTATETPAAAPSSSSSATGFVIPATQLSAIGNFAVISRDSQPQVLSALHDHIVARHPEMAFQRIFRARIPIMQFVPQLSQLQLANAAAGAGGGPANSSSEAPTHSEAGAPSDDDLSPLQRKAKRVLLQVRDESTTLAPSSSSAPSSRKREHFDISLSLDGCRNSLLLRRYMETYPQLRAATMALKHWGRRVRILNARRGWLSPYSLTVMLVHYAKAAGLVELISPAEADAALRDISANLAASVDDGTDAALDPVAANPVLGNTLPPLSDPAHAADVATYLEGFFRYFVHEFDFDTDVVDIRTDGRVTTKEQWFSGELRDVPERERWHRCGYEVMMIRDPYENHSLGRSVEFFRAEGIREEFRRALVAPPEPAAFFSKLASP